MTTQQGLSQKEKKQAYKILRGILFVLLLAIAAEVLIRAFPSFLAGREERRWLEWLSVSLIGACAYLVWNVAIWYRRSDAQFEAHTPWYIATAAKGPIIALVILLALTHINFAVGPPTAKETTTPTATIEGEAIGSPEETTLLTGEETPTATVEGETESSEETTLPTDEEAPTPTATPTSEEGGGEETTATSPLTFGIDFSQASDPVLLFVAFVLGFYNRFAQTLLFKIGGFIFGSLWKETFPEEEGGKEETPSAPVIRKIVPEYGEQGEELGVEIFGKNFQSPTVVKLVRGPVEIQGEHITGETEKQFKCKFNIPEDAETAKWDLVVMNQDGGEDRLDEAFEVRQKSQPA